MSATSFRHRFKALQGQWIFDPVQIVERCSILASIDMPFPQLLFSQNLDYFANLILLGLVVPDVVSDEFADVIEQRGLCQLAMLVEAYEKNGVLKPIEMRKLRRSAAPLDFARHHLAGIGHVEEIVEASFLVGGRSTDAMYDPQNLARNTKKAGKLQKAAMAGAVIGGAVGVLIPIPGLFFAVSAAGSVGARWVAGKFINSDGEELASVVPVASVRAEIDAEDIFEAVQDFDEDSPEWQQYLRRLLRKRAVLGTTESSEGANSNLLQIEDEMEKEQAEELEKKKPGDESWSRNILSMFNSAPAESSSVPVATKSVSVAPRSHNPLFSADSSSWTSLWSAFAPSSPPIEITASSQEQQEGEEQSNDNVDGTSIVDLLSFEAERKETATTTSAEDLLFFNMN